MSQIEIHYQSTRGKETISLFFGFLQDHQSFCSFRGKESSSPRNLVDIGTLVDVFAMTFGVKPKPLRVWGFWSTVTVKSWASLTHRWNEPRVLFLRITFAMVMSTCRCCADKTYSWGGRVIFELMYWVNVFIHFCTNWKWTKPSVMGSTFSTFLDIFMQFWVTKFLM